MAKHKLPLNDPEVEKFFHEKFVHCIRSHVLQRLLLIDFLLSFRHIPFRKKIERRLEDKNLPANKTNLAYELKPKDIMEVLGCSRRMAFDYMSAMRVLWG